MSNKHSSPPVNRAHIRQHFSHAAPNYDEAAILQKTVAARVDERLELTTLMPLTVADIGAGTGLLTEKVMRRYPKAQHFAIDLSTAMLQQAWQRLQPPRSWFPFTQKKRVSLINADAYALPLADQSIDLLVSNLMLQWCDDLDRVFQEFRRVLKPEGLIMFTTFGPDTLKELKQAWSVADPEQMHVNHFVDMHDIGDALIRNGFGQPVMDVEHFTLTYDRPMGVLKDLKAIGATNASLNRERGLMGKHKFQRMLQAYEALAQPDGKIPATYEVVHGHAWAAQEVFKGPERNRDGLVEISLDEFARQTAKK
ncbi:malonyl-ACP O-methyltransferase BioC [Thiomicrorhabdus sp. zzn3]|uniref:malonyl-ACP O-methyltransferase BioC n=1 Tax=Thiomicrorhabdus sp. zzn3 TaxID=3039775 RepID=UPI0024367766|nr:malonyl-ACP O-methyltransferase BioC [Thiomicrorhabdus sp. zzn3]MDG6778887.1 malonyl-ACP O-methyltransferase BioC [Thiomicrorhabdus sp. zzn3]